MSGPKTSHYTLTAEQRRQLEEQRRIRQELLLLDQQRMRAWEDLAEAERLVSRTREMVKQIGEGNPLLEQLDQLKDKLQKSLEDITRMDESSGLEDLQNAGEAFHRDCRELNRLKAQLSMQMESLEDRFQSSVRDKILEGFRLDFSKLGNTTHGETAQLRKKLEEELNQTGMLELSDELRQQLSIIREKAKEISNAEFLRNYRAMTVLPILEQCRQYHALFEKSGREFRRKYLIYRDNCRELELVPQEISFGPGAMEQLEALVKKNEETIAFRQEQQYISRCMDEAMQQLGYSLLGDRDVVKRSGKKFRNALYLFEEGTAVNVTFGENGQITMELGGLDDCDRLPTDLESRELVREMDHFCGDFRELEKMLIEKGIVSKRISILPSHEEYAQIINVSDYHLRGEVSYFQVEERKGKINSAHTHKVGE